MSAKQLKLNGLEVRYADDEDVFVFEFWKNDSVIKAECFDRNQAYLLMLYLQEHLK